MPEEKRMTTRLKELFERPEIFVLPGGMNPMGARMAELLGFEATTSLFDATSIPSGRVFLNGRGLDLELALAGGGLLAGTLDHQLRRAPGAPPSRLRRTTIREKGTGPWHRLWR